jgi:hypothetical protein
MSLIAALHKCHVSKHSRPQDSNENPIVRLIIHQHREHRAKRLVKESLWFVIPFAILVAGVLLLH